MNSEAARAARAAQAGAASSCLPWVTAGRRHREQSVEYVCATIPLVFVDVSAFDDLRLSFLMERRHV